MDTSLEMFPLGAGMQASEMGEEKKSIYGYVIKLITTILGYPLDGAPSCQHLLRGHLKCI